MQAVIVMGVAINDTICKLSKGACIIGIQCMPCCADTSMVMSSADKTDVHLNGQMKISGTVMQK